MIEIAGFSPKQKLFADIVWALDSQEAVDRFIASLPPADAQEARVVVEMLILAFTDEVAEIQQETIDLIDRLRV